MANKVERKVITDPDGVQWVQTASVRPDGTKDSFQTKRLKQKKALKKEGV